MEKAFLTGSAPDLGDGASEALQPQAVATGPATAAAANTDPSSTGRAGVGAPEWAGTPNRRSSDRAAAAVRPGVDAPARAA